MLPFLFRYPGFCAFSAAIVNSDLKQENGRERDVPEADCL